jgi:uncharacterized protein
MFNSQVPLKFRMLGAIIHALGLVPGMSIPITWVLWMTTKEVHPFVDRSGRCALNFQSSVLLYIVVAAVLFGTTSGILPNFGQFGQSAVVAIGHIGSFLAKIFFCASLLLVILATILAVFGKIYRYPLTVRFLSEFP